MWLPPEPPPVEEEKKDPPSPWEALDYRTSVFSDRLKVPGGWIVRTVALYGRPAIQMLFVADAEHTWVLDDGDVE